MKNTSLKLGVAGMRILVAIMAMLGMIACGGSAPVLKAPESKATIIGDASQARLKKWTCVQKGETEQARADYVACLEQSQEYYAKILADDKASPVESPMAPPTLAASASASSVSPLTLTSPPAPTSSPFPIPSPGAIYGLPPPGMLDVVNGGPACQSPIHRALHVWNDTGGTYGGAKGWLIVRGQVQILPCDMKRHFMPALVQFRGEATARETWAIPPMGGMDGMDARLAFTAVGQVVVHFEVYESKWMDGNGRMVLGYMIGETSMSFDVPRLTNPYSTTITSSMLTPWSG